MHHTVIKILFKIISVDGSFSQLILINDWSFSLHTHAHIRTQRENLINYSQYNLRIQEVLGIMYTGKCRILKRMIRRPQDRCGGTFGPRCHCLVICHPCVIPLMAISCSTAGTSITFQVIQIALMNGCSFCTINVESKEKHHDVNNDVKIIMKFI